LSLDYGTSYAVTISTEAKDLAGNNLAQAYSWEFAVTEAQD